MMGGGSGHGGHSEPQAAPQGGYAEQPMQAAPAEQPAYENPCNGFSTQLMKCMQANRGEIAICQNYMDMLNQCERDQGFSTYQ